MPVVAGLEDLALVVHIAGLGAPQHELADGVGEARVGQATAFLGDLSRRGVVGGQQDLEGRAVDDLRVELARGAEGQQGLVAGVLLELGGDLLHGRREVGGNGHRHFGSLRSDTAQQGKGGKGGGTQGLVHVHGSLAIPLVNSAV